MFTSPCTGIPKKNRRSVVMIKGIDSSESLARSAQVLFLLGTRAGREVEETRMDNVQYMELTLPLDKTEPIKDFIIVRGSFATISTTYLLHMSDQRM